MITEFRLGTTVPNNEPCIQLGKPNYSAFAKIEANVLMSQIVRNVGFPPVGCKMKLVARQHDFGTYYDIALVYDSKKKEHTKWMKVVESSLPESWDSISADKLKREGYHL